MQGMTALELLTVMLVISILLAVSVPSFADLTQRNRILSEVNGFVADLQFARSEAIRQGLPVIVCVSSNGSTCSGNSRWHEGWIVFVDANSNTAFDSGEPVMRYQRAWESTDTFVASGTKSLIAYNRDGFASGLGGARFTANTTPVNAGAARCVTVSIVKTPSGGTCP